MKKSNKKIFFDFFNKNIGNSYRNEYEQIKKLKIEKPGTKPVTAYSSMSICIVAIACSTVITVLDVFRKHYGSVIFFGMITLILFGFLIALCIKDKDELLKEMKENSNHFNTSKEELNLSYTDSANENTDSNVE